MHFEKRPTIILHANPLTEIYKRSAQAGFLPGALLPLWLVPGTTNRWCGRRGDVKLEGLNQSCRAKGVGMYPGREKLQYVLNTFTGHDLTAVLVVHRVQRLEQRPWRR